MKTPLVALAALLLAGCTLHYRESYLVSPQPTPAPELEALRADFPGHGFEEQRIGVPGASLYALAMTRPDARATVLYFGGNGFRIGRWIRHSAPAWGELPVDVVFVDHRGYGASTGEPGIGALMDDAVAVYDHVAAWSAGRGRPVIVHGQSLGSFMAGRVAAERRLDGLVLESSATTTEEWVEYQRSRLPWWQRLWIRRVSVPGSLAGQGNLAVAPRLDEPVLFLVGEDDSATPPDFSRRLHEATALPEACKRLVVVPGRGHNDATRSPAFVEAMADFIGEVARDVAYACDNARGGAGQTVASPLAGAEESPGSTGHGAR